MKLLTARKTQQCSNPACLAEIERGEEYYGNSYSAYCVPCGKKKLSGELQVRKAPIVKKSKCKFCKEPPIHVIDNIPVCGLHTGDALGK